MQTRDRLISTARRLFATAGFEGTSTDKILSESGVSRGAMYYHFADKRALFTAVLEAVEADIVRSTDAASASARNPVEALKAGFGEVLRLASEQEIKQIVLIDAHSVVGWQTWREIDERHGFGRLKAGMKLLASYGQLPAEMADLYAHMLLASLFEVAFLIARAPDPEEATKMGRKAMNLLLDRLVSAGAPD